MDPTDRTTTRSRTWKQARLVRVLAAALLLALTLVAAGGLGPDDAEAARNKRGRSAIKMDCVQLEGEYFESSDGTYGCLKNGLMTYCDRNGWCILICFEPLGCNCAFLQEAYDECVRAKPNPNTGDDRRVVDELDTVGASAEDPPPDGPPVRSAATRSRVVAAEADPARTPVPDAAE